MMVPKSTMHLLHLQPDESNRVTVQQAILYLAVAAGFSGAAFGAIDFGPIHLFPYRILLPLLLYVFAITSPLDRRGRIFGIQIKRCLWFLIFWLFYAVMSLVWAYDKAAGVTDVIFLFLACSVIYLHVYYMQKSLDFKRLYWLWFITLVVLLAIGFWENLTGQHLQVSKVGQTTLRRFDPHDPSGVFYNPNDYATYLSLSIPFALGFVRYGRSKLLRVLGLVSAIGAFYLIVATQSRANILAVFLELSFLALFLMNTKQRVKLVVLVVVLLVVIGYTVPNLVRGLFLDTSIQLNSLVTRFTMRSYPAMARIVLARRALRSLHATGGFGVGAGNIESFQTSFGSGPNLHNWWMEILANYGIIVLTGYVGFYASILQQLSKARRILADTTSRMICETLLLANVGFLLASISSSSIMAFRPQWLLFAFTLAFLNYIHKKDPQA